MSLIPEEARPTSTNNDLTLKGFKAYQIRAPGNARPIDGRRDFYKLVLGTGQLTMSYGEQTRYLEGTFLMFFNPLLPHSVVHHSTHNSGYACLFTDAFIANKKHTELLQYSPLFRVGDSPIIQLTSEQAAFITALFQKMIAAQQQEYAHNDELVKTCLTLLLQEALRLQPPQVEDNPPPAALRITQLFRGLLEQQFPLESPDQPLRWRTAQDFAGQLAVHVNYLNRCVKQATGKPTSVHIAERLVAEAQALLRHTRWSVADIASSLGFAYPTYFQNFFKRATGVAPASFRRQ